MSTRDLIQIMVVAVAVTAATVKLLQLTRPQPGINRPAVAAMCGAIITMGIANTQEVPSVVPVLTEALGSNFAYAQRHTPALACFFLLRLAFVCWVWPPGWRRRQTVRAHTALFAVVVVARWLLAALAPTGDAAQALDGYWMQAPTTMVAMLIYVAYMGLMIGSVSRLSWLWARSAAHRTRWTARGLRLIAAGAATYELYLAHKIAFLGIVLAVGYPPYPQVRVEWFILVPGTLLLVIGLAMPLIATGVPAAVRLARQRAAYGRLGPLWLALTSYRPEVVLGACPAWMPRWLRPAWDRFVLVHMGFRLYRRVIECWDIVVGLHGYCDERLRQRVYDQARESTSDEDLARSVAEAVMIRTALESARTEDALVPAEHRAPPQDHHPRLRDNVAWWQRVARAWGHPLTAALSPPLTQLP
ncbi:hypothetical protein FHX42_005236 [Saccharopolyspora lacisalsi]|uniref:DUF6545 domain-containing protein n=1 Tax=Halosaccharopolyspora lacisalsi TaxID=1000566 RepID=A0A839E4Q1_9PSEU|nr:MAB_1171c family putative transporter [Halosaccharopolyspora lacisalsi]MBA8827829.1 hypothetical protein [Halosaccharopolyspora lacisalsi]